MDLDSTGSDNLVHSTIEEESSQALSHTPLSDYNVDSTEYALIPYNPRPVCEIHFDDTTSAIEKAFESELTSSLESHLRSSQELSLTILSDVDLNSTGSDHHLVHGTIDEESSQHFSHIPLSDCNANSTGCALMLYNLRPVCEIHFDDTLNAIEKAFQSELTSSQEFSGLLFLNHLLQKVI